MARDYKIINPKKRSATRLADTVLNALLAPSRARPASTVIDPQTIRRILVIRTAYIGDVIMTLPMLKPLKKRFPKAAITFLTSSGAAPVLEHNPYADEVLAYDAFWFYDQPLGKYPGFLSELRQKRFDLVIEARADIRDILLLAAPAKARFKLSYAVGGGGGLLTHVAPYAGLTHKVTYHLNLARHLGCDIRDIDGKVYLTSEEQRQADDLLIAHGITGAFICVHPGSRMPLKQWPIDKCAELYDLLIDTYQVPLVILGAPAEKGLAARIQEKMQAMAVNLSGRTSLRQMTGILARANLLVCNDSAPMHLAAAMQTPTVAIFGPSKSLETAPYGPGHQVVEKDFPCRFTCDEHVCRHPLHQACMQAIEVSDVVAAVGMSTKG